MLEGVPHALGVDEIVGTIELLVIVALFLLLCYQDTQQLPLTATII